MLKVFVDGTAARTPKDPIGKMRWSWLITDAQGTVIAYGTENGPDGTQTEAEYFGLIAGLKALHRLGHQGPARVCGDSESVIRQAAHQWRCNTDHLIPLRNEAAGLVRLLKEAGCQVQLEHIPRTENLADALLRPPVKFKKRRTKKTGPARMTAAELEALLRPAEEWKA